LLAAQFPALTGDITTTAGSLSTTAAATQNNITSVPNLATVGTIGTGVWHGTAVGVTYGGTGANLSATGGTGQYVKQVTSGGAFTVGTIASGDVPTLNQNTTGTAANITGTSNATLTTLSALTSVGTIGTGVWQGTAVAPQYGGTGQNFSSSTGVLQAAAGSFTVGTIPLGNGSYVNGQLGNLNGGTGLNTSSSTGVPIISSGTWSVAAKLANTLGGTGQDSSGWTGVPSVSSGTWSNNTTLPLSLGGTNAATQQAALNNLAPSGATNGQVISYNGTNWVASTPAAGTKNYLTALQTTYGTNTGNGNFEFGTTTGWALGTVGTLTNGLPTGTPNFSGSTTNLSISTVSSGQLEGGYSLSYAMSAASTAGNMVATSAFYIDQEDQAKVLTVKFYYKVNSGASNCNFSGTSSNSFAWAAYDVTNSVWLSTTGNFNLVQSSGVGYCTGTIQTGSSTQQIALCFYNATATSGAATLYLDSFYVGPQTAPMGPAMTDWVAYTPTFTGFGTPTGVNFKSRRVGDSLEIMGTFTAGTPTATANFISIGYNGGNSNVVIDTSKVPAGNLVGMAGVTFGSTTTFGWTVLAPTTNASVIQLGIQNSTNAGVTTNSTGNGILSTSQSAELFCTVPIVGWSSNTTMSSDTDTRVVAWQGYYLGNQSLTGSATTALSGFTTINDTHGAFSGSTYTVPVTGYYYISGNITLPSASGDNLTPFINKNGSSLIQGGLTLGSASGGASVPFNGGGYFKAGDTITFSGFASTTFTTPTNASSSINVFSINRLSGPAVVAATESVSANYGQATGTAIAASGVPTTVAFDTKNFDSHNAMTTGSSAKYTAPVSGKYRVSTAISWTNGLANGAGTSMFLYKNGSSYQLLAYELYSSSPAASTPTQSGSTTVSLNAGDYISIVVTQTSGGAVALQSSASQTYLAVERIGN
jgi:hypothetical protein